MLKRLAAATFVALTMVGAASATPIVIFNTGVDAGGLALPDGSTASMVRLWVRKGSTALKIEPFHVQDTAGGLGDYFRG